MAKEPKENCPRCNSDKVAHAKDNSGKRYCQVSGCMHIWTPMTKDQSEVLNLKRQVAEKEAELIRLREQVRKLIEKYEPRVMDDKEIFK